MNKSAGKLSIVCAGIMSIGGCATTDGYEAILNSWVGDTSDHLVSVWGVPSREYDLGNGGKTLEYARSSQFVIPGRTVYRSQTTYDSGSVSASSSTGTTASGTYTGTSTTYVPQTTAPTVVDQSCVTRFSTDSMGRIVNWAWEGNACRAAKPKQQGDKTSPPPEYKKCTADQLRRGECN
jgi:hypothetical protein